MISNNNPEINVEELMQRIREEVARRKSQLAASVSVQQPAAAAIPAADTESLIQCVREEVACRKADVAIDSLAKSTVPVLPELEAHPKFTAISISLPRAADSNDQLPFKENYGLTDFLNFHDESFVRNAYRGILRRSPDTIGFEHYLGGLREGRFTKAEILGRLRFSPEGKTQKVKVKGLFLPFAIQTAYRIPVLGDFLAIGNFIVRLPVVIKNWNCFEAFVIRSQQQQNKQLNDLVTQVESCFNNVQRHVGDQVTAGLNRITTNTRQVLWEALQQECSRVKNDALNQKAGIDQLHARLDTITQLVEKKADSGILGLIEEKIGGKVNRTEYEHFLELLQALSKEVQSRAEQAKLEELKQGLEGLNNRKVDKDALSGLSAQLEGKVNRTEYEHFLEQLQGLSKAVEIKADNSQVTALTNHLVGLIQNKTDKWDTEVTPQIAELSEVLSGKVDRESLSQLNDQLSDLIQTRSEAVRSEVTPQIAELSRVLSGKVERESLSQLNDQLKQRTDHLNGLIQNKTESLRMESESKLLNLAKALETKADADQLVQFNNHIVSLSDKKADETSVMELKSSLESKTNSIDISIVGIQRQIQDHKRNILDQQRRITLLLEEARKRLPEPISHDQIQNMVAEEDHLLDAMYASFEDRFRGTREDIKQRQSIYLPIVLEAKAGAKDAPILDLGCGRGEWLEILHHEGLIAKGVDINRVFLEGCRELGLDVVEQDAIAYLRSLKSNSIGAVTAFHLIEHLPLKTLIALMDEALRVLQPGGLIILETPNPKNLLVGTCSFYMDPTHIKPLPRSLCEFLLEARGFVNVAGMDLNPFENFQPPKENENSFTEAVNQYLFGPRDIAIIGRKA